MATTSTKPTIFSTIIIPAQAVQINARGEQDRAGLKENDSCPLSHSNFF